MGESQAITELAEILYDFLPGKPHPFADQSISFPGIASKLGLSQFWRSGSKKPAIAQLLRYTLERNRGKFCDLILEIVQTGMVYRSSKNNPVSVEDIRLINSVIERVGFKIPELWDPEFLDMLPRSKPSDDAETSQNEAEPDLGALKKQLFELGGLDAHSRGYAFERFLNQLFSEFGLRPRPAFRLVGEQIDGSFQLGGHTYLLEAKWHDPPIGSSDLLVFQGKVEGKSKWSRGLFISHSGFSPDGLIAFGKGRPTSILGFSGQDLYFVLEGKVSLQEAIAKKARRAAESGEFYIPIFDLVLQG
jgi:hypothetical protein